AWRKGRIVGWNGEVPQTVPPNMPADATADIPLELDYPDVLWLFNIMKYGWQEKNITIGKQTAYYKDVYYSLFDPDGVTLQVDVRAHYKGPSAKADFEQKEALYTELRVYKDGNELTAVSSPNNDGRNQVVIGKGTTPQKLTFIEDDQLELKP